MSYAKQHNLVLQAYSPLGGGGKADQEILSGALTTKVSQAHNKSQVQVALKWIADTKIPLVTQVATPGKRFSPGNLLGRAIKGY